LGQPKLRRIGWLTGGSPKSHAKVLAAFREGLREHGWVEGRNIALELRWAEGDLARLPALAEELARLKPEVILTAAQPVNLAMKKATSTIPIVMATGADPVGGGLVASVARPGGNVTGLSGFYEVMPVKMIELACLGAPVSRFSWTRRARSPAASTGRRQSARSAPSACAPTTSRSAAPRSSPARSRQSARSGLRWSWRCPGPCSSRWASAS
jgi:putative ABC transport system substrate-binding protein